jgi:pyrimidine-specific ribonucleoside hydrolase
VIDTDPGIDDALAILLALASPEVDLRLVTTVHGNVELPQTTDNALRVLHLAGRSDVPVAAGARSSLVHPQPERAGHVHGESGLGGVLLPASPVPVDPRPAVVALAELLMTSPEPVTVAAIGPLTNLALLLGVYPRPRRASAGWWSCAGPPAPGATSPPRPSSTPGPTPRRPRPSSPQGCRR